MNPRERLPSRRASTTFDFECACLRYVCSYSCYADGRIGELFLGNHKSNPKDRSLLTLDNNNSRQQKKAPVYAGAKRMISRALLTRRHLGTQ
jgi:hypothetical protein